MSGKCKCDQCAFCFSLVAESERMDIVSVKKKRVCTHPGNCTHQYLYRYPNACVLVYGVRAQNGIVLNASVVGIKQATA